MAKCDVCGKGVTFGIKVSHSHRRSNRAWKPNVKRVKAVVNGTPKHINVCTRCLRTGKVTRAMPLKRIFLCGTPAGQKEKGPAAEPLCGRPLFAPSEAQKGSRGPVRCRQGRGPLVKSRPAGKSPKEGARRLSFLRKAGIIISYGNMFDMG